MAEGLVIILISFVVQLELQISYSLDSYLELQKSGTAGFLEVLKYQIRGNKKIPYVGASEETQTLSRHR